MKLNQFIPNSPKIQSPRKPVVIAKGCAAQTWRMLDIGKLINGIHNLQIFNTTFDQSYQHDCIEWQGNNRYYTKINTEYKICIEFHSFFKFLLTEIEKGNMINLNIIDF